jgi:predicted MFS family arabinose efflux permease
MQAVVFGWSSSITMYTLGGSIILLIIFAFIELKTKDPLANLNLFKNKTFLSGNIILLCTQIVVMCLIYWAIWLQKSLGLSSAVAGIGLLPAGIPILFMGKLGGKWLDKYGPRKPILLGSIIILIGMLILGFTAERQEYWLAFIGFLCYGTGAPLIISPAIVTVLNSVPDQQKGMASGILNTMRQLGATLCFAVVGVVITNIDHIHNSTTPLSSELIFSKAFGYGMFTAAIFAFIAVLFAIFGLKKTKGVS